MHPTQSFDPVQRARHFSTHLGKLAAELPKPDSPLGLLVPKPSFPPRLTAILSHFHRVGQERKEGYRDLRQAELNAP